MKEPSSRNTTISKILTIYANLIFVVLWIGFVIALIANQDWLDGIWIWAQALPSVPKIIVWGLFLPILVGLWIWDSSWPTLGRLIGFTGLFAWTLLAVYSMFKYLARSVLSG